MHCISLAYGHHYDAAMVPNPVFYIVSSAQTVCEVRNLGANLNNSFRDRLTQGAYNLLLNCAECRSGDTLLIVCETGSTGFYDPSLGVAIKDVADELGIKAEIFGVPLNRDMSEPDETLTAKMQAADCTVFLARLGDQIRFRPKNADTIQVVSYVLDCGMLASPFGTIEYNAFDALKLLVNEAVSQATDIHVTCPAGTDFRGSPSAFKYVGGDTTLKRFPVSVFAPIPAHGFSGRVAQNGFLTGTGSQYYSPWACELKDTLFVNFMDNRITEFEGSTRDVAAAKAHYDFVGNKYDIDTYFVHSWHAGIHPGCEFKEPAGDHFERWGSGSFGNPRILHFHTCGAYPPGEISLNVLDPTVRLDGVPVWEDGQLYVSRIPGGEALLEEHPDMRAAFEAPATQVGQAANGRLMYA